MRLRLWTVVLVMLVTTSAARAQEPVGSVPPPPPPPAGGMGGSADLFGTPGQIVLTGELEATVSHVSASMGDASSTSITLAPLLDYFAAPNLSIGGGVAFTHSSFDSGVPGAASSDSTTFGLFARVGYNARLGAMASIWPRLWIGYGHSSSGSGSTSISGYDIPLRIDAPILIHLAPHFFVGIGPAFQTQLIAKQESQDAPKITVFGIATIVGGYFGGV